WTECKATIKGAGNIKLVFSPASNRFFLDEVRVEAIGNESGISSVTNSNRNPDQRIYDLKGRFVGTNLNALKPGLYIQNGKKIIN
ncbi:MAG: peptidase, partial [Prevotella sp.]|nr:peptidase [Prevotella sp.]